MNKEFLEKAEKQMEHKFGYVIRCDDNKAPKDVETDMYFELWQIKELNIIIELCEKHNLKYDLALQSFDTKTDTIEQEIDIVSSNSENN